MAEKKRAPRPKRKPKNPFQRLQETVEGLSTRQRQILRIAPANDEALAKRLKRLEQLERERRHPRLPPKRTEENI